MAYPSPRQLQLRRGNTAQISTYTGPLGEVIVNTDTWNLYIQDGTTVGGHLVSGAGGSYSNATVKSYLTNFNGNIIPSANVAYTLGNITHQWKDLFVSNNTIYVGGVPLSIDSTGNLTINGNVIPTISYVNSTLTSANLTNYAWTANVTSANVGMRGYVDATIRANIANISIPTTYSNANVASYLAVGNVTLGNITIQDNYSQQWQFRDGALIWPDGAGTPNGPYIEGSSLMTVYPENDGEFRIQTYSTTAVGSRQWKFTSEGNLTIPDDGTIRSDLDVRVFAEEGNIALGTLGGTWMFGADGRFTAPGDVYGQYFTVRGGGFPGDEIGSLGYGGDIIELYGTNGVRISTVGEGGPIWQFDDIGTLTFPDAPNGQIFAGTDNDFIINTANTNAASYFFTFTQLGNLVVPVDLIVYNSTYTSTIVGYNGNLTVTAGTHNWQFDNTGVLTLPNNSAIIPVGNAVVRLSAGANDTTGLLLNNTGDAEIYAFGNLSIYTDSDNAGQNWTFDTGGNITFPDDTVQTTAWTGTAKNITSADDITITNASGGSNVADIYIESADDITVQAKNRTIPGPIEGGDLNLYAGSGGADDVTVGSGGGGDIQLYAGDGGAGNVNVGSFGGAISIVAGNGGAGSATARAGGGGGISITAGSAGSNNGGAGYAGGGVFITAGDSSDPTFDRGSIVLTSGDGGDETSVGGYVQINIPAVGTNPGGEWVFTGVGTVFEPPPNAEIFSPSVGNLTLGTVGNTIIRNIGGVTTYNWVFGDTGNLTLPAGGQILDSTGNIYAGGSSYSNVQVATYLPIYSGNIANIRLGVSGVLTFSDGTTQSTAATGGGSNYSNVNVKAYTETMGFANYSNVNVAALITTNGLTNYSNVNAKAYTESMGFKNYSNVNVASYLGTGQVTVSNVKLAPSGNIVFADGTIQTTAASGGSNYGNANVASYLITNGYVNTNSAYANANVTSYLPTHTGNVGVSNLLGTTPNVTLVANSYSTTYDIYGNVAFGNAAYPVQIYATGSITTSSNVVIGGIGVTMPNRPAFRVNGSAGPTQTTSNVNLKSPQTTVIFNQGSYYNDTTGQFVAPVAGIYQVSLVARVTVNSTAQIAVLRNGLNNSGNVVCFWEADTNIGTATHFGVTGTVQLAVGDYLSANIVLGSVNFDGNDNWCVTYLG